MKRENVGYIKRQSARPVNRHIPPSQLRLFVKIESVFISLRVLLRPATSSSRASLYCVCSNNSLTPISRQLAAAIHLSLFSLSLANQNGT